MTVKSRMRDSVAVISSTMPSAIESATGSPDMLSKGSTTIDGRSAAGRCGALAAPRLRAGRHRRRRRRPAPVPSRPLGQPDSPRRRRPHPDLDRLVDALQLDPLDAVELRREALDQLPAHRMGDGDAARRRRLLQAHDEADRRAEAVVALDEDVGERRCRRGPGSRSSPRSRCASAIGGLEGDGPADRCPRHWGTRPAPPSPMVLNRLPPWVASVGRRMRRRMAASSRQRAALVPLDEARVAGHVERGEDRQLSRRRTHPARSRAGSLRPRRSQAGLPNAASVSRRAKHRHPRDFGGCCRSRLTVCVCRRRSLYCAATGTCAAGSAVPRARRPCPGRIAALFQVNSCPSATSPSSPTSTTARPP